MKLSIIETGLFKLDGGAMHGVIPKSMWNKANPADERNMCTWSMRCLLVEDEDRLILIDTGMGGKQSEKFFSYYEPHGDEDLISSIRKAGYQPEDITDVFLTHLHFDHCGGAVSKEGDQLFPTFSEATYWTNETHWNIALKPNAREKASFLKENLLPLQEAGKLKFVTEEENIPFSHSITVKFVSGHTEAMMLPLIHTDTASILYCADLIPSKAHVSLPWVMAYDMQPLLTLGEKERILKEALEKGWILFYEHDARHFASLLQQTERGIRAGEDISLPS